jgi:hypothetical protein
MEIIRSGPCILRLRIVFVKGELKKYGLINRGSAENLSKEIIKHGLFTLLWRIVFVHGDYKTWTIYLVMEYSICTGRL